jgi:hypothetical protein
VRVRRSVLQMDASMQWPPSEPYETDADDKLKWRGAGDPARAINASIRIRRLQPPPSSAAPGVQPITVRVTGTWWEMVMEALVLTMTWIDSRLPAYVHAW